VTAGELDFTTRAPVVGDLDIAWIHGSPLGRRDVDPPLQVHAFDEHTYVLRQSMAVSYEAPFMYLLFGNERALLLDTGATAASDRFPLRETVDRLVGDWLASHPRTSYGLVVAHTHGHADHVAADGQFDSRPSTTVVGADVDSVRRFFGFTDWPADCVRLDLGGRVLEVSAIPGHHCASIAVYDPWAGWLLTGDTVYPGRLYVEDMAAFTSSLDRLVEITSRRRVTAVLGCHVEMSRRPGRDYPIGCTYQPDEHPLAMTVRRLAAVRDAAVSIGERPGAYRYDDFTIFNGPCRAEVARQLARTAWGLVSQLAVAARRH
jgi:hydroxyacylglutathione hydrolase